MSATERASTTGDSLRGYSWIPDAFQSWLLSLALGRTGFASTQSTSDFRRLCDGLEIRSDGEVLFAGAHLDWGTARLLPLIGWQVRDTGLPPSSTTTLTRILAGSMLRRRQQDATTARFVDSMEKNGIPTLVLKGGALGRLVYPDPGTRPMSDTDLLIRPTDFEAAAAWVTRNGGTVAFGNVNREALVRFRHSAAVTFPDGEFDLHWRTTADRFDGAADDALWRGAVTVPVGAAEVRTPQVAHHLVHAIVHGMHMNAFLPPVRWVADATLLARSPGCDWDVVVADAKARRSGSRVALGLADLEHRSPGLVPQSVVAALSHDGPRRLDRWYRQPSHSRVRGALKKSVVSYALGSTTWPTRRRLFHYPSFLRYSLDSGAITPPRARRRGENSEGAAGGSGR